MNLHQGSIGVAKIMHFQSVVSFRHKSTGFSKASVIIFSDHGLSFYPRTEPVYRMKISLRRMLLAKNVRVFCGVKVKIRVKHLKIYISERLF